MPRVGEAYLENSDTYLNSACIHEDLTPRIKFRSDVDTPRMHNNERVLSLPQTLLYFPPSVIGD